MIIRIDDPGSAHASRLLTEHLAHMATVSPPESIHALNVDGLRAPGVTFWTVWEGAGDGAAFLGCGALREINPAHGEIKSMRTVREHLRKGVASAMLRHILEVAMSRGYTRLSLETGSQAAFEPARSLYRRFGFVECGPFEGYKDDPSSVFMTRVI